LTYDLRRFPRLEPGVLEGHTANVVIDRFDRRVRYSRMALNMSVRLDRRGTGQICGGK
jgi:hypothetical protein